MSSGFSYNTYTHEKSPPLPPHSLAFRRTIQRPVEIYDRKKKARRVYFVLSACEELHLPCIRGIPGRALSGPTTSGRVVPLLLRGGQPKGGPLPLSASCTYVRSRGFHGLGSTSEGPNWLACLSLCPVGLANSCPNIGLPQVVHRRTIRVIVSGRLRREPPQFCRSHFLLLSRDHHHKPRRVAHANYLIFLCASRLHDPIHTNFRDVGKLFSRGSTDRSLRSPTQQPPRTSEPSDNVLLASGMHSFNTQSAVPWARRPIGRRLACFLQKT